MARQKRRTHSPAFKAKMALTELAQQYDVHPNRITAWKGQLVEVGSGIFGSGGSAAEAAPAVDVKTLHAKIGKLTLESDFLSGAPQQSRPAERMMIDRPMISNAINRPARSATAWILVVRPPRLRPMACLSAPPLPPALHRWALAWCCRCIADPLLPSSQGSAASCPRTRRSASVLPCATQAGGVSHGNPGAGESPAKCDAAGIAGLAAGDAQGIRQYQTDLQTSPSCG
jgi:transposase